MVPQPVGLYPHLTVAENIAFPLRGAGLAKPLRAQMVQAIAARFGLEADLGQLPRSLSGGQQQRVALARALVRDPALVVMDDPLCHLDARLRSRTRRDLRALTRERGTTTLVATHDPAEALALGDRIAVLQGGRLQQLAPPQEVYDRPANAFVAGFVGVCR